MASENRSADTADDYQLKDKYSIDELLNIMALLRSEHGCPWDKEQTHQSLKANMLEEVYEALDAVDSGQPDRLCDELGDVLMQVVFHAQIAAEENHFNFSDVVSAICYKLISRHTHIFAEDQAETAEAVIETWEKNKRKEKGQRSQSQVLDDVPRSLPALLRGYKIQQKAAQTGFDWDDRQGPLAKIQEELAEVEASIEDRSKQKEPVGSDILNQAVADEVGDLLFAVVNYARHLKVEPEIALNRTSDRFIRRFREVEIMAKANGQDIEKMSLAELDLLWDRVKNNEGGKNAT